MAKNSITDYSKTAASNTDIQSVDIDEGCLPSGINNAIRELMADLADMNDGTVTLTSPSFAAATITGDLTVDTSTLKVDSGNNRVGIGTSSPSYKLHVKDSSSAFAFLDSSGDAMIALDGSNGDFAGGDYFTIEADSSPNLKFTQGGTERMRIDSSGNVGIGASSVDQLLHVEKSSGTTIVKTEVASGSTVGFEIAKTGSTTQSWRIVDGQTANGVLEFYDLTNTATRMAIKGNGNVGIGTSSNLNDQLTVGTSTDGFTASVNGAVSTIRLGGHDTSAAAGRFDYDRATGLLTYKEGTYDSEGSALLAVTNSGAVGIGTSSPSNKLDIKGTVGFEATNSTNRWLAYTYTDNTLRLNYNGAGADEVTITSGGNVGIGTSSPSAPLDSVSNTNGVSLRVRARSSDEFGLIEFVENNGSTAHGYIGTPLADTLAFYTNGLNERMRIDSSGDVLMGNTVPNPASGFNDQSGFGYDKSAGKVEIASTSGLALSLGRNLSSDGHLAEFRKQSNSVGDIQTHSGKLQIGQGNANLQFSNASDAIIPSNGSGTLNDDALDIGLSNARFDDIYATNGTIQTSDRNEKQDIEALSEAEQRVAVAAKGLLRKFRWIDSVEEKGDDARIHFGIIAQDLQAAFEAEGLDAGRYAMFINSTWTDEETGEERSRMGVRYNQLLAFIIAAI